jgi:hypothetical protein
MWYWGIGGLAGLALIGQLVLRMSAPESTGLFGEAWHLVHFFTILTNLIVAIVFLRAALTGRRPNPSWSAAITLWIGVVGAVYWALLYRGLPPSDPEFYTDHAFHTLVPLGVVLWWWMAAPKALIGTREVLRWLVFPVGYGAYVLIRGAVTGGYPYFFLDVGTLGYVSVLINLAGFALLFGVLGCILVGLSRLRLRGVAA